MIRMMAPRCSERRNAPSFRVLLCRSHEGHGCGRSWTANGEQELADFLAERDAHESICLGPVFAAQLRAAAANPSGLRAPRASSYPVR